MLAAGEGSGETLMATFEPPGFIYSHCQVKLRMAVSQKGLTKQDWTSVKYPPITSYLTIAVCTSPDTNHKPSWNELAPITVHLVIVKHPILLLGLEWLNLLATFPGWQERGDPGPETT